MTAELIGILTVGVALAALHLTTLRGLRSDLRGEIRDVRGELRGVRDELRSELHGVRDELRSDIHALDDRMRTQERSTARMDGHLQGLCEAVAARFGALSGAAEASRGTGSEPTPG